MPAGFPSTEDLTTSILNGDRVYRGSDSSYDKKPKDEETLPDILNHPDIITVDLSEILKEREKLPEIMVNWFHEKAKQYYSSREWFEGRKINYEDIFYLVQQAYADEMEWEIENPAIHLFIKEIKKHIQSISDGLYSNEYFMILSETYNYIEDMIREKLSRPSKGVSPKIIGSIYKEYNISCIVTLSHDTHLERFLKNQDIPLADGFSDDTSSVARYWNRDFSSEQNKIPFFKIHGSISWFTELQNSQIAMLNNMQDYNKIYDFFRSVNAKPKMLIGTLNKMSEYTRGMFLDIYYNFRCRINEADIMIICGYSFGDKAINEEIISWYANKPERRFVIIHHCPKRLIKNARPAIQRLFCEKDLFTGRPGVAVGATTYIPKKFEDVIIDDIHDAIAS